MTKLIALIVEDDTVFALPAWHRTIPLLERRGLLVTHVAVVPSQVDRYRVRKFWRTNQDTAINQRPLVQVGQTVTQGEVIADGSATEAGELALGANVVCAFMPWYGHNFEDAIVLSERLVKDDVYSSIHIQ